VDHVGLGTRVDRVVGDKTARSLAELEVRTVGDLLRHLPRRYAERGELTSIRSLAVGEQVTVIARVEKVTSSSYRPKGQPRAGPRTKTDVVITDGPDRLTLTFFNQPWRAQSLRTGTTAFFAGKVGEFRGQKRIDNPEVEVVGGGDDDGTDGDDGTDADAGSATFAGALTPIYPATKDMATWKIRRAVDLALGSMDFPPDDDPLPTGLRERHLLPGLGEAFRLVHRPDTHRDHARGRERLVWDEALVVQLALARRRAAAERLPATPRPSRPDGLLAAFDAALPFARTRGQREIGDLLAREVARDHPMHRLLQGEVGSGKTLIALRAMLQVVDAGGQAALLAPTEVLATQHARAIRALLGPLGRAGELEGAERATRVALLTGSQAAGQRRAALDEIATGEAGIVVGTHALLEVTVQWRDLAMVVVDEQHRFGVEQRDALRSQGAAYGATPHVLVMTATPIPRTVAMTVFGDLEVSALTELPGGRQPIASHVVPADNPRWLERMWQRVREQVAEGRQAFVVCPRISPRDDEAEATAGPGGAAVEEVLPLLRAGELAGLRVGGLHGRMGGEDKDAVMTAFSRGDIDVLVATTVVEVGLDVPNATVMVVLDADRFGVSQLHQLRGRVGRGNAASTCLLETAAEPDSPARGRVEAVAATSDGAALARLDLQARREGDVLGASQSGGTSSLRLLSLLRDEDVILAAREEAVALVADDPHLLRHPPLARALREALPEEHAAFLEKG